MPVNHTCILSGIEIFENPRFTCSIRKLHHCGHPVNRIYVKQFNFSIILRYLKQANYCLIIIYSNKCNILRIDRLNRKARKERKLPTNCVNIYIVSLFVVTLYMYANKDCKPKISLKELSKIILMPREVL